MRAIQNHLQRISQEDSESLTVDIQEPTAPVQESEPEEVETIAADGLIEAEPATDGVRAELEELNDINVSLEHFGILINDALDRGGFRPEEGIMFQTSMEHFQRRLEVVKTKLGLEDFGGNMSRMKATQIAQEDWKETARVAAEKIKELLAKLVAFVKEQAAKWRGNSEKTTEVVKQAQEIIQTAQKSGVEAVELDLTKVTALTKADMDEGFKTLIASAKDLTSGLADVRDVLEKYGMSVKTLQSSDESDLAVAYFARDFVEQWYPLKPMLAFAGGKRGVVRKLSHAAAVTYVVDGGLEVTTSEEARNGFTLKVTPAELNILNGKVHLLNQAIQQLNEAYAETSAMLTRVVSADRKLNQRKAAEELAQTDFDVVTTVKTDIYYVIANLVRSRDQAGYIMGAAAKALQQGA